MILYKGKKLSELSRTELEQAVTKLYESLKAEKRLTKMLAAQPRDSFEAKKDMFMAELDKVLWRKKNEA